MTDNGPRDFSLEIATLTAIMGRSPNVDGGAYHYWIWYPFSSPRLDRGLRVDYWSHPTRYGVAGTWTLSIGDSPPGTLQATPGFEDVIKRLTNDADLRTIYIKKPR